MVDEPTCRGCGEEEETPIHLISFCEAFKTARKAVLGSEYLTQEEILRIPLGEILTFFKGIDLTRE